MMILELQQTSSRILVMDCPFPEAKSIIEGNNPGWLFVDDVNAPSVALVWAQGLEGFYLIGDASNTDFHDGLDIYTEQVLKPRLCDLGITWLEISGGESWNPVIEKVYRKRVLESSQQWVYTLNSTMLEPMRWLKGFDNVKVKRIDRQLLIDLSAVNKKYLFSRLTKFWHSVDAFLDTGLGYALLEGEEIVSLCFSGFVAGNIHAIDIETNESHRRKGYAKTVAQAFIADCIEKRLQPHWDCMAENTASVQLAEKLGFKKNRVYTLYSVSLQE